MTSLRMYPPRGFTRSPGVRALLDPHECRWAAAGNDVVQFDELTAAEARRLLMLLPPEQAHDRQNCAPSFAEMVELGERYPGILFHGYRVDPGRSDERVTLEGFYVPVAHGEDILAGVRYPPDEWHEVGIDGQRYYRAWWD